MAFGNFTFTPATDDTRPLTIAVSIAGSSGSGKTYSALRLARGIAGGAPFGMIDTENRRAMHYRAEFPEMQHLDFSPLGEDGKVAGFGPDRWIAVLDAAEAAGFPVIVIDSFSHAWEGIGGVLEMQAEALERLTNGRSGGADQSMRAWAEVKPKYRRLLERIIRARCHIILCIRAKPVIQKPASQGGGNIRPTKLRRADLPWDIASDKDLVFEMTVSLLVDHQQPGVPIPIKCADQFKGIFATGATITEGAGEEMLRWASGGDMSATKTLLDAARDAASGGKAAFQEFWASLPKGGWERQTVNSIMDEVKRLAAQAEASVDDDPFGTDPAPEDSADAEGAA